MNDECMVTILRKVKGGKKYYINRQRADNMFDKNERRRRRGWLAGSVQLID